jgi:hypothetical protein
MTMTSVAPHFTTRWHIGRAAGDHPCRRHQQVTFDTVTEAWQRAGELMHACLDDERQLNVAFTYWPVLSDQRSDDSLNVAYQMLWHYECDAGLHEDGPHKTLPYYADIQFQLLHEAALHLSRGEALPWEMREVYRYHEPARAFRPRYYPCTPQAWLLPLQKILQAFRHRLLAKLPYG